MNLSSLWLHFWSSALKRAAGWNYSALNMGGRTWFLACICLGVGDTVACEYSHRSDWHDSTQNYTEVNCCPKASAVKTLLVITLEVRKSSRNTFPITQLKITSYQMEVWFLQTIFFGLTETEKFLQSFSLFWDVRTMSLFPYSSPSPCFSSFTYTDLLLAHSAVLGYLTKCSYSTWRKRS